MNRNLLLACFLSLSLSAAEEPDQPLESAFDFWVGDWELSWTNANGTAGKATNRIETILDGKALQENFSAVSGFKGRSLSVFNPKTKVWRQSWVDNQGSYLSFTGEVDGSKRIFRTDPVEQNGSTTYQRMVFYDIRKDSFTWDWMQTQDNGENWKILWSISYKRKS